VGALRWSLTLTVLVMKRRQGSTKWHRFKRGSKVVGALVRFGYLSDKDGDTWRREERHRTGEWWQQLL
jgi:hypothetical protein